MSDPSMNGQTTPAKVLTLSALQERGLTRPDGLSEINVGIPGLGVFHCETLSEPVLAWLRGRSRDERGMVNQDYLALLIVRFAWLGMTPVGSHEREIVERSDAEMFRGPTPDGSGLLHCAPWPLVNAIAPFAMPIAISVVSGSDLSEEDRARLLFPDGSQSNTASSASTLTEPDADAAAMSADNGANPSTSDSTRQ